MATRASIAIQTAAAQDRIDQATNVLAERFDVQIEPLPFTRDLDIARIRALERMASLLEQVVDVTAPKKPAAKSPNANSAVA